ncbi:hypothetical protein BC937DRAFT_89522 [Endogone sp. FLAS-F59071]|nr:hypothetical protein BC937DRAFT_89522 [Endogone sp. FLAS-F59071]|eukprot:RUS17760.1 hypothetical protein BC937DRAFT_89522 [Endogone sp. FLAS-F59071]
MARTKQTARKSSGGHAPSEIRTSATTKNFRAYVTGQQATSHAPAAKKTSFLNYENMFYSFAFDVGAPEQSETFTPRFFPATTLVERFVSQENSADDEPQPPPEKEVWLGLSTVSKYDGEGMRHHLRPPLDLVISLDISGSMDSPFNYEDENRRSKLELAKEGLYAIMAQLRPDDRLGIVVFDTSQLEVLPLTNWAEVDLTVLRQKIRALRVRGGTDLSGGMRAATNLFGTKPAGVNGTRAHRILFLTDLNSSCGTVDDEAKLLELTAKNAESLPGGIYTTVIGVGMDFNVSLVEKVSKMCGCRYTSITSVGEFQQLMEAEFDYDVTPIAFDIKMTIESGNWTIDKAYGSPELAGINSGEDDQIVFSSEFATAHDENGNSKGGFILFRLKSGNSAGVPKTLKGKGKGKGKAKDIESQPKSDEAGSETMKIRIIYKDVMGKQQENLQEVQLTALANGATGAYGVPFVRLENDNWYHGTAVRKAIALVKYIDLHNDYILDDRNFADVEPSSWMVSKPPIIGDVVANLKRHQCTAEQFATFRSHFVSEIEACGEDKSLQTFNQAYLEMIDKIVELETGEVNKIIAATANDGKSESKAGGKGRGTKRKAGNTNSSGAGTNTAMESIRAEVICVICLDILDDPVQLNKCLHCFCRSCLAESVQKASLPGVVPTEVVCPTCKVLTPSGGVKSNFVLKNIVECLQSYGGESSSQKNEDTEMGDADMGQSSIGKKIKKTGKGADADANVGESSSGGGEASSSTPRRSGRGRGGGEIATSTPRRSTRLSLG